MRCRNLLSRKSLFCSMCGVSSGEIDELTRHDARFVVTSALSGRCALCSTCLDGMREVLRERRGANDLAIFSKSSRRSTLIALVKELEAD